MKEILLTQGRTAVVDDEDYGRLSQWKWQYSSGYAIRSIRPLSGKRRTVYMHREVMHTPDGMETDHINGDGVDNRKQNLRNCTHAQNQSNDGTYKNNTSGYKGVSWHKRDKIWQANISINSKQIYLGEFSSAIEAAEAYDIAAKKYHGEFAQLNFPKDK